MKPWAWHFLVLLCLGTSLIFSFQVIKHSLISTQLTEKVTKRLSLENNLNGFLDKVWRTFGNKEHRQRILNLLESAESHRNRATHFSFLVAGPIFLLVIITALLPLSRETKNRRHIFIFLTASIVTFIPGIIAPVLSLLTYKDIPVIGPIVFKYQCKGIAGTIVHLLKINPFLAIMIGLFSIIVPLLKLILSYFALFHKGGSHIIQFLKTIGKWSMTDVFIVSILLSFFALSSYGTSTSRVEHGLYFFPHIAFSLSLLQSY